MKFDWLHPLVVIIVVSLSLDGVYLWSRSVDHSRIFSVLNCGSSLRIRILPAIGVYLVIALALWWFVFGGSSSPRSSGGLTILGPRSIEGGPATAFVQGSLLGFSMYGLYDLTNYATLKEYPLSMMFTDIAWGTIMMGTTAGTTAWLLGSSSSV